MTKSFLEGVIRGFGLLLAPGLMMTAIWYRQQHLTSTQNLMVLGIISLLFFCVIGYSVFHRLLWHRFGRATLFCFVTWALVVAIGRIYDFFFYISSDTIRAVNTISALFFTLNLCFFVWLRPWAITIIKYLYGPEIVQPEIDKAINHKEIP